MEKPPWVVDDNLRGRLDLDSVAGRRVAVWAILVFCRRLGTTHLSGRRVKTILLKNGIGFRGNQPAVFLARMARFYQWRQLPNRNHHTFEVPYSSIATEDRWYLLDEDRRKDSATQPSRV